MSFAGLGKTAPDRRTAYAAIHGLHRTFHLSALTDMQVRRFVHFDADISHDLPGQPASQHCWKSMIIVVWKCFGLRAALDFSPCQVGDRRSETAIDDPRGGPFPGYW